MHALAVHDCHDAMQNHAVTLHLDQLMANRMALFILGFASGSASTVGFISTPNKYQVDGYYRHLYSDQGRLEEALAMYERALEGYDKVLSATSIWNYIPAWSTIGNFGLLWERQGNAVNALLLPAGAGER